MGTTSEKLTYLNTTKGKIKDSINLTGANITNEPFRQYSTKLEDAYIDIINNGTDTLYNNFPKVSGEGTSLTLNNTYQAPMRNNLKGNTSQTGTPTPSSPIPVNVVSGDNEINVVGKNLLINIRNEGYTVTSNGITFKVNADKSITISGTATDTAAMSLNTGIPVTLSAGTYTLSKGDTSDVQVAIWYDSALVWGQVRGTINTYQKTITEDTTINNWRTLIVVYTGVTVNTTIYPMLEKGSTATSYEPYQGNTYNIDLPVENLFDKGNANTLNCLVNGTNGAIANFNGAKSLYIPIQSGRTYTILKVLSARFVVGTCVSTPANGVTCSVYRANNTGTSITITSGASDKYLCVFYYLSGTDTLTEQQILDSIQIEVGSKANSYTPYGTTPIELCKIGNYQDYFYKDSDKWYKYGVIGKVVFTGGNEETWEVSETSTQGSNRFLNRSIQNYVVKATNNNDVINMLSNCFIAKSVNQTYLNQDGIDISTTGIFHVYADSLKAYTVAQFKTWLSVHNLSVYYPLATPTSTEITDTTLINQLEELYIAKSKENQTNISQINNDLPFIISASALKKG